MKKHTSFNKKLPKRWFWPLSGTLIIVLLSLSLPVQADSIKKVALVPLIINAPDRMEYLREGVEDMLSSRLTWEDKVLVLNRSQVQKALGNSPGPVDESRARQIAKPLGADVVLWGSITIIGSNISLDLSLLDITSKQPLKKFFAQSKGMDDVIQRVNEVADQINGKVFGREALVVASATPSATAQPKGTEPSPGKTTSAPVPISLKGFIINPLSPQIIVNAGGFDLTGIWRSSILPYALIDMAFGDLDGDGRTETVIISKNRLYIYRYAQEKFELIKEIPGDRWDNFIAVDVADIHGTGHPQIFITNYRSDGVQSLTLAWDKGEYKKIARNIPYHFRVHDLPGRGTVLLGQKAYGAEAFDSKIYILSWKDGKYVQVEHLKVPEGLTVFNFVYTDLNKDGSQEILYLNSDNRLNVLSAKGQLEYSSSEFYGGTVNFVDSREDFNAYSSTIMDEQKSRVYIPARLLVASLAPGKKDIIINKNKGSNLNILARYRAYTSGEILSLSWDGATMKENWRTQTIPDYLANYGLADFKNIGQKQLVVGIVQSVGFPFVSNARSVLYCYDLGGLTAPKK